MIDVFLIMILVGSTGFLYFYRQEQRFKHFDYLQEYSRSSKVKATVSTQQAVDLKALVGRNFIDRIRDKWEGVLSLLGDYSTIKLLAFWIVLLISAKFFNEYFLQFKLIVVALVFFILGNFIAYGWLRSRQRKIFEETFPVALNMLTSAVSSGESITQAVSYVGETLDGVVGEEFRVMGKRLQMGESPEDVFRKSCVHLPYPTFYFFVITLRANMERGGQLKDIIQRLNRLMFNIRAIEKKKYALTSEARASTKIVGAIPFIFLIMMRFMSPENYDYIMNDETGKYLLYYMLISEAVGISIVWGLMKSVR